MLQSSAPDTIAGIRAFDRARQLRHRRCMRLTQNACLPSPQAVLEHWRSLVCPLVRGRRLRTSTLREGKVDRARAMSEAGDGVRAVSRLAAESAALAALLT